MHRHACFIQFPVSALLLVLLAACSDDVALRSDASTQPLVDARAEVDASTEAQLDAGSLPFSFFVTSLRAMRELSGSQDGFGGDLRYGETGDGAGLRGADKICTTIAEASMQGSSAKVWRAFLSTVAGGVDGGPVHAVDRIGDGPWYDRLGRLVGMSKADLVQARPAMADARIRNDLPNEDGVPNHDPDGTGSVDNHDVLTGSDEQGRLYRADRRVTCDDWTKSQGDANDAPRVGHSWPRTGFDFTGNAVGEGGLAAPGLFFDGGGLPFGGVPFGDGGFPFGGFPFGDGGSPFGGPRGRDGSVGRAFPFGDGGFPSDGGGSPFGGGGGGSFDNWMSALDEAGCAPGVSIVEMGAPIESNPTVGSGGGYGAIYCFALSP